MKRCWGLIWFVLVVVSVKAQAPQFSQFYATPTYLNPAFAGSSEQGRVILNYRNQWPAIPGAYVTYNFSYDQYVPEIKSGIGLIANYDRAGRGGLSTTNVSAMFSHEFVINRKLSLTPGVQFTSGQTNIDLNKLTFYDQLYRGGVDRATVEQKRGDNIKHSDFAAGFVAFSEKFWFSGAVHHINRPNKSLLGGESELPMKFNVNAGFETTVRKKTVYKDPIIALFALNYKRQLQFSQLDVGCSFNLYPMVFGFWYRGLPIGSSDEDYYSNRDALVAMLGYHIEDFRIGYSYDMTVSKLITNTGGAHELSITYEFITESARKKRRRYRRVPPCAKFL